MMGTSLPEFPIGRSGFAAGWGSGLSGVRGSSAGRGWVNSDRIPWDCPAIVAGFSSYARKGIAMSKLRKRMIQDMRLAGLVEGTQDQYLRAVRQLAAYYMISPDHLSERHVEKYILYVRDELGVARGTFVPIFFGLKFFYVKRSATTGLCSPKKSPQAKPAAVARRPQ